MRRLRGIAAYGRWLGRQHPDVVVGLAVFLMSAVGAGLSFTTPWLAAVLFGANALVVAWSVVIMLRAGNQQLVTDGGAEDWTAIRFDPPGAKLVRGPAEAEAAVVWPDVDEVLWASPSPVERRDQFRLDPQARSIAITGLKHHLAGPALLFNEAKVRLDATLTRDGLVSGETVGLQRTDYFASLVTNELTLRPVVRTGQSRDVSYDGVSFFLSGERLLRHESSRCSDHIGVSVHAITRDGMLVSTLQASRSGQDPGRFAPAGSGSMDWADLARDDASVRLVDLVAAAMRREVAQECGCDEDAVRTPLVTGYARLLHRGGKPEFFGVCTLDVTSRELTIRRPERPFVADHQLHPVDLAGRDVFFASVDRVTEELGRRQTMQWTLSTAALRRHAATGLVDRLLGAERV